MDKGKHILLRRGLLTHKNVAYYQRPRIDKRISWNTPVMLELQQGVEGGTRRFEVCPFPDIAFYS